MESDVPKYLHQFEDCGVLFLADLTDCQKKNKEDEYQIFSTLKLFESICNSKWLKRVAPIVCCTKYDLFQEKLKSNPLEMTFQKYNPFVEYEWNFIRGQFDMMNPRKLIKCHFTNATDTDNIAFVMKLVRSTFIHIDSFSLGLE